MFIVVQNPIFLTFIFLGAAAFVAAAWRRLDLALAVVLFFAPLYLLKIYFSCLPLTVLEFLILLLIFVWFIKKAKNGFNFSVFKESGCWQFWCPVFLILAGTALGTVFSVDLKVSVGIFKSWILEPLAFGLLVVDIVKTKKQFKKLLLALVLSGVTVAAISLFYLFFGRLTFDSRLAAFYLSPNHLAMYLAPAFLLVLGFWFEIKKRRQRFLLFVAGCLLLVVVYLTFSYAAWLGILAGLIFLIVYFYRQQILSQKSLFFISGILVLVLALGIWGQLGGNKLESLFYSDRSSWQSRLMVWQAAGKILKDNWLIGIGPGLFQKYYFDYQKYFPPYLEWAVPQPHSLFLAWWLQAGLLGLAGFVWLIISFFRRASAVMRKQKSSDTIVSEGGQSLVLALMAVIIYCLIHGLFDTPFWKNDLALVFWVIISLGYRAGHLRD